MARPRSSKPPRKGASTSFGKRSDAEKSFRKKGPANRSEGGSSYRSGSTGKSFFKPTGKGRPDRAEGSGGGDKPSFGKPSFSKPSFGKPSFGGPKRPYTKKPDDLSKSQFGDDSTSDFRKRPGYSRTKPEFLKRNEGDDTAKRPLRGTGAYGKQAGESPRKEGGFKREFKRDDSFKKDGEATRGGDFKREGGFRKESGFKKEGGFKREGGFKKDGYKKGGEFKPESDSKPEGEFKKESGFRKEGDFKKEGFKRESGFNREAPRAGGFRKDDGDRKSFVQSRVVSLSDFTKPGRKSKDKDKEENSEATLNSGGITRLNKYIANSGVGSRRDADKLITMGLISVNGVTITTLGTKVNHGDVVRYEDKVLKAEKPVYILLNKPKGFITTTEDPQDRNTVMNLVAGACKERIYPVGRLDRNTTGLLLLTNDGDLADKLTHPSYQAKKVYKAELDKPLTKADFQKILDGVQMEEGRAMVDDLAIISDDSMTVGLEIHIGWNRVVRRIFESLGYNVVKLDRSVYAGLDKKETPRGQWRFLKPEEIVMLKHFK